MCHRLIKARAARAEINQRAAGCSGSLRRLDRGAHHIGAKDHTRAAACGRVVDVAVFADAKFAQVVRLKLPQAVLQGTACQALAQYAGK